MFGDLGGQKGPFWPSWGLLGASLDPLGALGALLGPSWRTSIKKDGFLDPSITSREVIFDMWNGQNSSSADYGRLRVELTGNVSDGSTPLLLTVLSGSTGFFRQSVSSTSFTSASLADGNWHHLVASFDGTTRKIYYDGNLLGSQTVSEIYHRSY